MRVYLAKDVRDTNRDLARNIREAMAGRHALLVNIVSSPGSGKTALLERTLSSLSGTYRTGVIAGDLYTTEDAQRLEPWCHRVVQVNTQGSCHLEAATIHRILTEEEDFRESDVLFIENVGNLVCPAGYDLGEDLRVALLSVTEGPDKPRKYPVAFKDAHAAVISKTDLLPYCDVDLDSLVTQFETINPQLAVFPTSAKTGKGLSAWLTWLEQHIKAKKQASPGSS